MASLLDHFRSLMGGGQALPVQASHGITPAQRAYMATNHYNAQGQPTYETLGSQTPLPSAADWNAAPPAAANQPDTQVGLPSPRAALPYAAYRTMLTAPNSALGLPTMNPQLTRSPVMPTANPQNSQINPMASSPVNPQRQVASPMRIVMGPVADQTRISLH